MAVRGLMSIWLSSVNKIRDNLNSIWLDTERVLPDGEVKDKIKKRIDIIFYLLSKGRVNNETSDRK